MNAPIMIPGIAENGSLFPIEKLQAHVDAVFHLAVSVFVFDGGDLLIQRRAKEKYHCGGMWANTCCTHPHWGEDAAASARRRLREELGFELELERRGEVEYSADVGSGLHEHERVTMFVANVSRDAILIEPNPSEVMETRWVSPARLHEEIAADPQVFTPWFRIYCQRYPDLVFPAA